MSVPMSQARQSICNLFEDIKKLDLVLSVKNSADGDLSAVNAHGHFSLFPKNWKEKDEGEETLIACLAQGQTELPKENLTATGEPPIHVHVDWGKVGSVRVKNLRLHLIETNFCIALLAVNSGAVLVAFYGKKEKPESQVFLKRWPLGDHPLK